MTLKSKPLTFPSVTSVTLPNGNFLFFPEWNAKPDEPVSGHQPKPGAPTSLIIREASTKRPRLQGAIVGNTLFVVLDRARFRRLAAELRGRPLTTKPVTFDYALNERGALKEFRVDDADVCGDDRTDSYVKGLKSSKGKSGTAR